MLHAGNQQAWLYLPSVEQGHFDKRVLCQYEPVSLRYTTLADWHYHLMLPPSFVTQVLASDLESDETS